MKLTVDIQNAADDCWVPSEQAMTAWIEQALVDHRDHAEISLRLVAPAESQDLNQRYRDKNKPTNVLSFCADIPEELNIPFLGDLVVCADQVNREALEQNKSRDAHWAHILVHGTLHLLGYDHIEDSDAEIMESLESQIVTSLGYPPPYELIA